MRVPAPKFPLGPPTWPGTVPRPPVAPRTGTDFDTAWARSPAARLVRAGWTDLLLRPAVQLVASPEVDGRERLERLPAPAIFAANHRSHLDTGLLLSVLPERFRHKAVVAAASDYFFSSRAKGTFHALAFGAVPVERQRVNRRSGDVTAALVEDGWSLVIFPEGGRSPDGWGQGFRGGAAYLSVRTGVPVVPVYLEGTWEVWPKGRRLPRAGTSVSVTFGEPMTAAEGEDARKLAARLEAAVAMLADERRTDWWSARRRAAAGTSPALTGPDAAAWRRAWTLPKRRSG